MVFKATADINEVGKWIGAPLIERFDLHPGTKKHKIVVMAKECAKHLKLADWEVESWSAENITMEMIKILAASKECSTSSGVLSVAWQLSGVHIPGIPIENLIVKYFGKNFHGDFLHQCSDAEQGRDVREFAVDELCRLPELESSLDPVLLLTKHVYQVHSELRRDFQDGSDSPHLRNRKGLWIA